MPRTLLTSDHGFAMPAEWSPHAATWMAWPCDDELWLGELEPVRREFAELVRAIAAFEPVELLVRDAEAETDAASRLAGANVRLHRVPYDDVWLRDSGPIFVGREGRLRLVNWEFNGWGGKYDAAIDNEVPRHVARILGTTTIDTGVVMEGGSIEVNGAGCVLTTRQCLLSPTRNPDLSEAEIEALLAAYLGTPRVLWLDTGLEGDHTDGHIDTITRFTDAQTIVTVTCEDRDGCELRADDAESRAAAGLHRCRRAAVPGRGAADAAACARSSTAHRLPLTYANFYIVERRASSCRCTATRTTRVRSRFCVRSFPVARCAACMARHLITGGGAFHCVTQQQPVGVVTSEP